MAAVAAQGVVLAARMLAGDDLSAVCRTFVQWRERGQRELPWLAGPAFSALAGVGIAPPAAPSLRVLERFLVGAETDPERVRSALADTSGAAADAAPQPPDARGALVDATRRFFDALAETYGRLHAPVRDGHRRYVEDILVEAQPGVDTAAADIEERALVLRGRANVAPPRPRKVPDRAGVALGFVVVALMTAVVIVWLVLQGWPVEPVRFDL